jgi:hypothetical protein
MDDKDDIDLLYILRPHGWSICILHVNGRIHELSISHVFGEPIRDLVEATIAILKGATAVEFTWWSEPGGVQWQINRNIQQQHRVKIVVTDLLSDFGEPVKPRGTLAEFEIKTNHFSTLVYTQMLKIMLLLQEQSFEKNRSGEFPYVEFRKLATLVNPSLHL